MRTIYFTLFFLLINMGNLHAQIIQGTVADSNNEPIESVAVVIQTLDSLFVDAVITDETGSFSWECSEKGDYCLLFQHLQYETYLQPIASSESTISIQLKEKANELGEIVVKGERPLVKVEGGKLTYDIPELIKDKTSTNAFDVVKELPGIISQNEGLQLAGARSLQIILNGQQTTMSMEQMIQLLKSMPASRIESAEVMYNAPAKYNVKGALINIVFTDKEGTENSIWQGEVGGDYFQRHYASGEAHTNLLYTSPRLNMDFLVNGQRTKGFGGDEQWSLHTLGNEQTEIDIDRRINSKAWRGTIRAGIDYRFTNEDKLSFTYYLNGNDSKMRGDAYTIYSPLKERRVVQHNSTTRSTGTDALHNIRMQYDGHAGWQAGIDYTHYRDPSDLDYFDVSSENETVDMQNYSKQNVSRWNLFANHTISFPAGWSLNIGVNGGYSSSKNYLEYAYNQGNGYIVHEDQTVNNKQKEYSSNLFAEVSKDFSNGLSFTAALKGEYFKSDYKSLDEKVTLWEDWTLFPTLSMNYMRSPMHIFQLNVSSDKIYPSYWAVSPQETPMNSYSYIIGNPMLKPYRSYEGQLVYIFRQKYMLIASYEYEPDYFTQVPYQSDSELKNIFRFENFNYQKDMRLTLVLPFHVSSFWNGRLTLIGSHMKEKNNNFHNISFNRKANVGFVVLSNTFNLSNKPNIKATIDGLYVTKGAIQGVYDLGYMYKVSAGLKYTFINDRATLTLNADDIFNSGMPHSLKVNQYTQQSSLKMVNDLRSVKLSFAYKFGGYKSKQHEKVDSSRFGK